MSTTIGFQLYGNAAYNNNPMYITKGPSVLTNVMYSQKDNFSSCGRRMNTSVITAATAVSAFTLCICTVATAIYI